MDTSVGYLVIHTYSQFNFFQEKYGGHGFKHILKVAVPKMLSKGITQEQVDKILKNNPKTFLCYWPNDKPSFIHTYQLFNKSILMIHKLLWRYNIFCMTSQTWHFAFQHFPVNINEYSISLIFYLQRINIHTNVTIMQYTVCHEPFFCKYR